MADKYVDLKDFPISYIMKLEADGVLVDWADEDTFKRYLRNPGTNTNYEVSEEIFILLDYMFWYKYDRPFWETQYAIA